ncbi:hypothetical protein [Actinoplanes sp. G11-F43]|uniref:hypothetical protein n=1 Tax=Actinoplanes sp. G11-F43 TaxID=3424130 RepID=UPI003D34B6C8
MNTRFVLALVLPAVLLPAPAHAAPAPTLDQIYTALNVDTVPSDHVLLVDVSGAVDGDRYPAVRRNVTAYLDALSPDDFVTLIPFDGTARATTRQVGRTPETAGTGLPATAGGPHTDIGAALRAAIRALGRPGAPPLATVVLLTGGPHAPGPGSAFPQARGEAWDTLTEQAAALDKTSLAAYAVPLSGRAGAAQLTRVFPAAAVLPAAGELSARLARPVAEARLAKARGLLAEEITLPVRVSWPVTAPGPGRTTVPVRVESPMPHVPLTLADVVVTGDTPDVSVSVPAGPVELPPGREITLPVRVDWDPGPVSFAPRRIVRDRVTLRLSATVTSAWSPVLTGALGLTPRFALAGAPAERDLSAQRGSLWRWIAVAVGLLLLTGLVLGRRFGQRGSS